MEVQQALGADIIMTLDEPMPYPAEKPATEKSLALSTRWAKRCKDAHPDNDQALFGIVQGGMFKDLRKISTKQIVEIHHLVEMINGVGLDRGRAPVHPGSEQAC